MRGCGGTSVEIRAFSAASRVKGRDRTSKSEIGGFTLLEVMVSLAILALSLTAIAGINANSFEESNYAKFVTVGTLLARSKMIDVEELLRKDGFGDSDKEFSGDFDAEGYPGFKWVATCRKVEVDVGQLVGGLLGGDVSSENLPEQAQSFLDAFKGEGKSDSGDKGKSGGGEKGGGESDLSKLLGGGGAEIMFKQVGETLANAIREITLEITWGKKGKEVESIRFVQYVVTTGRLAVPQGGTAGAQPQPGDVAGAGAPGGLPGNPGGVPGLPGAIPGAPPRPGDRNPKTLQTRSPFGATPFGVPGGGDGKR